MLPGQEFKENESHFRLYICSKKPGNHPPFTLLEHSTKLGIYQTMVSHHELTTRSGGRD